MHEYQYIPVLIIHSIRIDRCLSDDTWVRATLTPSSEARGLNKPGLNQGRN